MAIFNEIKYPAVILSILLLALFTPTTINCQGIASKTISFDFYGDSISLPVNNTRFVNFTAPLSTEAIQVFYDSISACGYQPLVNALIAYKKQYRMDDWLYYQLIRKTAQQISPKADNYYRYTLYKWFMLSSSGYDARLAIGDAELLFYVLSKDSIYDIPMYVSDGKQYVCLNYHDYGYIDFTRDTMHEVKTFIPGAESAFSYKITQMPDFRQAAYLQKELQFNYHKKKYAFDILLNPQVQTIFANYPVVGFGEYFNIPLSKETYQTLIPELKKTVHKMNQQKGIDFLMRFTRFAFLYEDDKENFGKEKHLSPEETLLYEHSDCDDRSGLFFYLVKEIYNLPMIVLLYPTHVTIAVKFDKPVGKPFLYNGDVYAICDPTLQAQELNIGYLPAKYQQADCKVVYAYYPPQK